MRWRTHAAQGVLNGYATAPTGCLERSAETPTNSTPLEAHQSLPLRVGEKTSVGWHRRERYDSGEPTANGRFLSVTLQDDRAHAYQYKKRIPFFCKARDC